MTNFEMISSCFAAKLDWNWNSASPHHFYASFERVSSRAEFGIGIRFGKPTENLLYPHPPRNRTRTRSLQVDHDQPWISSFDSKPVLPHELQHINDGYNRAIVKVTLKRTRCRRFLSTSFFYLGALLIIASCLL